MGPLNRSPVGLVVERERMSVGNAILPVDNEAKFAVADGYPNNDLPYATNWAGG